ncbi:hypothetical protein SAMN05444166_3421 [Singulisphaera sp. GP187]|nr:hypothetical protein SAMN05444166_3421 [Singulisphaera sp. GP187]
MANPVIFPKKGQSPLEFRGSDRFKPFRSSNIKLLKFHERDKTGLKKLPRFICGFQKSRGSALDLGSLARMYLTSRS